MHSIDAGAEEIRPRPVGLKVICCEAILRLLPCLPAGGVTFSGGCRSGSIARVALLVLERPITRTLPFSNRYRSWYSLHSLHSLMMRRHAWCARPPLMGSCKHVPLHIFFIGVAVLPTTNRRHNVMRRVRSSAAALQQPSRLYVTIPTYPASGGATASRSAGAPRALPRVAPRALRGRSAGRCAGRIRCARPQDE